MSIRLRSFATAALLGGVLVLVSPLPASAADFSVDTVDDTLDANIGDGVCADANGDCSLRAAVQEANAVGGASAITLGPGTYVLDVGSYGEEVAAEGDLDITANISVGGDGSTITTTLADRFFDVKAGGSLFLTGITLDGGTAGGAADEAASGGAVLNAGTLATSNTVFNGNLSRRAGGAIEVTGAGTTTTINSSTFVGNSTGSLPGNGGAIHVTGTHTVDINDSYFKGNRAKSEGGALWNSATGTMNVTSTEILGNEALGDLPTQGGGGIFNQPNATNTGGGTLTVTAGRISENEASGLAGSGGGVFNGGSAVFTSAEYPLFIDTNTAEGNGGGIEADAGSYTNIFSIGLQMNKAKSAPGNGGGLHITGTATAVLGGNALVFGNEAANDGGAVWNSATGTVDVQVVQFVGNTAAGPSVSNGGGAIFNSGGVLTADDATFSKNAATGAFGSGGGIFNDGGAATISKSRLLDNIAPQGGGIEIAGAATTTISTTELNGNEATKGDGGGIHVIDGVTTITDSTMTANTTVGSGGGLAVLNPGNATVVRSRVTENISTIVIGGRGGGGIYNSGSELKVNDSVIAGNKAVQGGGVFTVDEGVTGLTHATVTDNAATWGAGVGSTPDASINRLFDSIVAGNLGDDCWSTYSSVGGNVVGSCVISDSQDITGINDPLLDVNFVPQPGSPAIDRALDASTVDLVSTVRPLDGNGDTVARADSGALEAPGVPPTTEPTVPGDGTTTSTTLPGDTTTTSTTRPGDTTTTTGPNPTTTITPGGGNGPGNVGNGNAGRGGSGSPRSLPRTGSSIGVLVGLGLSLLGAGALILGSRRRLTLAPVRR